MLKLFFIFIFITVNYSVCVSSKQAHISDLNDEDEKPEYNLLSDAVNNLALKLYQRSADKQENYFISPYSIWTSLTLCYVGANGKTRNELRNLLGITPDQEDELFKQAERFNKQFLSVNNKNFSLETANRMFPKQGFSIDRDYVKIVQRYFGVGVEPLDFTDHVGSANKINRWVSEKTNDKIKDLVDANSIDDLTRIILVNAIYFKGTWLNQFAKANTTRYEFKSPGGRVNQVDMMRLLGRFKCSMNPKGLDASVCELPYAGEKLSMTIVLPHEDISFTRFERNLDNDKLKSILGAKLSGAVYLYLPRFKLEYKTKMNEDLKSLGIKTSFSNEADFTGISSEDGLFISEVVHQAKLEVNEEGAEAAAGTKVEIKIRSRIPTFICDRPFLIIIHDSTSKSVLFIGKYSNPNQ